MSGSERSHDISLENSEETATEGSSWIRSHIARSIGVLGGLLAVAILLFLSSLGFRPALFLLLFPIAGIILIFGGGKIHQA